MREAKAWCCDNNEKHGIGFEENYRDPSTVSRRNRLSDFFFGGGGGGGGSCCKSL